MCSGAWRTVCVQCACPGMRLYATRFFASCERGSGETSTFYMRVAFGDLRVRLPGHRCDDTVVVVVDPGCVLLADWRHAANERAPHSASLAQGQLGRLRRRPGRRPLRALSALPPASPGVRLADWLCRDGPGPRAECACPIGRAGDATAGSPTTTGAAAAATRLCAQAATAT